MTPQEELKILVKNSRWAFDELVVDQKMQEANGLCSERSAGPMFLYLRECLGSTAAVLGALKCVIRDHNGRRLKSLSLRDAQKK